MASMAAAATSGTTQGRGRASGNSIVIAGDRSQSRLDAHRHSRRVRLLRFALPLLGVATAALAAFNVLENAGIGPTLPPLEVPKIVADNLKMHNPHYQGFNSDGGHYWVKAETAQQDLKTLTAVHLDTITGELTDAKKQKTYLTAARGIFDNKSNVLDLYDSINVTGDGGLNAKLTRAKIQTKENIITSDQPSIITMGAGKITSNQLTIRQKTKEYTFLDNVRTHMQPKESAAATKDQTDSNTLPFGKPGQPVDVAANRLDIDDVKKTAIYTGGVVATQDNATMTSPEMTVTYEGSVAPAGKGSDQDKSAAPADPSGTKIKLIVARDSIVLKQPNGETATSDQATFNTTANTAVLEGDVVLSQGDDRRAVGDRVDYDQAAQTMVLTGPVVVTQGANVLKGRRLVYNRATQKMQLAAPANIMGSGSPGRITAHFVKPSSKAGAAQSTDDDSSDGISFGAAFKTDPNSPYDVVSDKLDVDDKAKTAIFTGNVSAQQGAMTMRSQELTAFYTGSAGLGTTDGDKAPGSAASLTHLTARKKVVVTAKDGQTATGDWAEVDVKKNTTTMGGAVVLTQGKNVVHGTKLVIDMNTGEATIKTEPTATSSGAVVSSSDGSGGGEVFKAERPSAVFYPGQLRKSKIQADGWQVRSSP
ncbi:MAG: LPS export ABC transporter periplasmic protein LptC [Hyphomicrobium sp.]|uniref:LPS export ABC transporter periplasmic protein LptC n=1 Tax=Hyphomicrobium sp. TaxID=82 RepID=UPI0039E6C8DE